ncbi:AraC family transcriptional regulator [Sphingomonas lacunae]|uniref:AraC family transcriptional regulator n=1 Tax=Sphingomonas lacunae TaxID=2698828 RepID=A0A6M4ASQ2_9SPHN|nr:helix-turn-helix domain-containing protein [Sphingomonas lacunae]QJQ31736.1 AraC family transcriptional regulator [Sphingomonas lacunae]
MLTLEDGETSASCFIAPHPRVAPYLSTYYFTAIEGPDGQEIRDWMNPEWASVRFCWLGQTRGSIYDGPFRDVPPAHFAGPTTVTQPFSAARAHIASIGFLPLGWHRFMREPAANWANRIDEASLVKTILPFDSMLDQVRDAASPEAVAELFDAILIAAMDGHPLTDAEAEEEQRIIAAHAVLVDPATSTVAQMTDRLGMTVKQLHRFSLKLFGFPPKLLIRRQRFIRTMAAVIHNPAANWADALDLQYYDQPHFNRDFREFFGMSPDQYRRLPHPVISAAAKARMKALGDPLQALQRPEGTPPA